MPGLGKAASKIEAFVGQIDSFKVRANSEDFTIQDLIEGILDETGYRQELEAEGEIESQTRLENIEELVNKAVSYEQDSEHPSWTSFWNRWPWWRTSTIWTNQRTGRRS